MIHAKAKLLLVIGILLFSVNSVAASFDCDKAESTVEILICADSGLSSLDEKMTKYYKIAEQSVKDLSNLKSEQIEWLGERNRCSSEACIEMRYQERIARLKQLAGESDKTGGEARYRLVVGKGYSICETFLKHLNALSSDALPMVCNIRPNPNYNAETRDDWDITQPVWEEMNVQKNLHLIFAAEMEYPPYSVYRHDPNKKLPIFDEWKVDFANRIKAGKLHPKIYRTQLVLNEKGGVETLIGYEPDQGRCERDIQKHDMARPGGKHIFVYNDDPEEPLKPIRGKYGSNFLTHILSYRGRPYFAWGGTVVSNDRSFIGISFPSPITLNNQPKEDVSRHRCSYKFDK